MRYFTLILLFCMFVNFEAAPQGEMEQPRTNKIFAIPNMNPKDTANDVPAVIEDPPASLRSIMGKGETGEELLVSFLLNENHETDKEFAKALAGFYITEAKTEGVNHDIAFAQMCLETGFLRFGGLVTAEMNNFCGLGSIGPGEEGEWFSSPEIGVRAHIQHLKAYASSFPLAGELVDPRYRFVRRGTVPFVEGLAGTWAADKLYAEKIELILERLYRFRDTASE